MNIRRLLVLAPHTDDAELGCGGTIARLIEEGCDVYIAAFSIARESLPDGSNPNRLRDEFGVAIRTLQIPNNRTFIYDYPVRKFSYHRQEILENLVALRRDLQPDTVFLPSGSDLHQDHQVMFIEGLRAYKDMTVWGYELPWNHITFSASAFVTLEKRHLDVKWRALQAYQSQLDLNRPYFFREVIEGLARVRGLQVKVEFAEAFEVQRIKL